MARTQALIQFPPDLLARLDAHAAHAGRSRSDLVREAVGHFLDADPDAEIDRRIVAGYTREPQTDAELAWAATATRAMLAAAGPWEDRS